MRSSYDRLHDQYWSSATPKAGTRYERLVAFVIKALHPHQDVLHDIKLVGDSDVKHQIDVTTSHEDGTRSLLSIEHQSA